MPVAPPGQKRDGEAGQHARNHGAVLVAEVAANAPADGKRQADTKDAQQTRLRGDGAFSGGGHLSLIAETRKAHTGEGLDFTRNKRGKRKLSWCGQNEKRAFGSSLINPGR